MKFVLAPDSFKECMTAERAAEIMKQAIRYIMPDAEIVEMPVGDGGEGTLDILASVSNGEMIETRVMGPLGEPVAAKFALSGDGKTAVVEMAQASGLNLVPRDRRNPLLTTTYGTGELIRQALDRGIEHLIVTIGGSATNDCGVGMLQALGAKLLDADGQAVPFGGGALCDVAHIDLDAIDPRLKTVTLKVACDVTNPLVGPRGASRVFGPQKGASPAMAESLDTGIAHFADLIETTTGVRLHDVPGAGAAGGLGAALLLCGGTLAPGIDLVLNVLSFDERAAGADYVLSGEGRIDGQTPGGKVIAGIVRRAHQAGIPVIAFGGSVQTGYESLYDEGLRSVFSITSRPCTLDEALRDGEANLYETVSNAIRLLKHK